MSAKAHGLEKIYAKTAIYWQWPFKDEYFYDFWM